MSLSAGAALSHLPSLAAIEADMRGLRESAIEIEHAFDDHRRVERVAAPVISASRWTLTFFGIAGAATLLAFFV